MTRETKEFDRLPRPRANDRIRVSRTAEAELRAIYPRLDVAFEHRLAPIKTAERIRLCNPDNMWSAIDTRSDEVQGLYAMIMLSKSGFQALLDGTFRPNAPSAAHCAKPGDRTMAIYKWAVLAPGRAASMIAYMSEFLSQPKYRNVDFYGNGATAEGIRLMLALGFTHVKGSAFPNLYRYQRLPNRAEDLTSPNSIKEYNNA